MLVRWLAPLLAAASATLICLFVAGPGLGLVIGGLFVATILAPTLSSPLAGLSTQHVMLSILLFIGIALPWLALLAPDRASLWQFIQVCLVLLAWIIMLVGVTRLLLLLRAGPTLAGAIASLFGLAILTSPVWLSPTIADADTSAWLPYFVDRQPVLVCNGILTFTAPWTEGAVAYQLTNLNQDASIELPDSIFPCVRVLLAISLFGWMEWALILRRLRATKTAR